MLYLAVLDVYFDRRRTFYPPSALAWSYYEKHCLLQNKLH